MARTNIPIIVLGPDGRPLAGASVVIRTRPGGVQTTVFASETGTGSLAQPLTTTAQGRVPGWVERGSYEAVATKDSLTVWTEPFDAAAASDRSIDALWLPARGRGPALPASPVDEMRWTLDVDRPAGRVYELEYDASITDAAKWRVLSGPPTVALSTGSGNTSSTTYAVIAGAATTLDLFAAGVWRVAHGFTGTMNSANFGYQSLQIGTADADDTDLCGFGSPAAGNPTGSPSRLLGLRTLAKTSLAARWRVQGGSLTNVSRVWIEATPTRISSV